MITKAHSCIFCKNAESEVLIDRDFPRHYACKNCGFVFMNPILPFEDNVDYYEKEYWETRKARKEVYTDPESNISPRTIALGEWCKPFLTENSRVLEIGSGYGYHLIYLRKLTKCKVVAIEPSLDAIDFMKRHDIEAHQATLEKFESEQKFDLIILSHVLEHFEDPIGAIRLAGKLLNEGGMIWIEVPNILNPHPQKHLNSWLAKEHISYFSMNKLIYLMENQGFKVEQEEEDIYVRILARKQQGFKPQTQLLNEFHKVKEVLAAHLRKSNKNYYRKMPKLIVQKIKTLFK